MAIPTSRTHEAATVSIDRIKCTGCGLCVRVCSDFSLRLVNGKAENSHEGVFGCVGCGQCMAVCPTEAIKVSGRTLEPGHLFKLPPKDRQASYDQLLALLQQRRSIREFQDRKVEPELVEKIIAAARTAPMGLPPSDVNVLIVDSKEKNRAFAQDFCDYLSGMKWLVSPWFLAIMRPFWGKANDELFKGFVRPAIDVYINSMKQGKNTLNYDAPLALYFYGSAYTDPADPIVAATYAMLAGEALGLGSCMLGAQHPLFQNGRKAKQFREAHGIKGPSREGLFVIFGYPAVRFQKGIERSFASVTTLN